VVKTPAKVGKKDRKPGTFSMQYSVANLNLKFTNQDLSYSMVRIPSIPHSKVVIKDVKRRI